MLFDGKINLDSFEILDITYFLYVMNKLTNLLVPGWIQHKHGQESYPPPGGRAGGCCWSSCEERSCAQAVRETQVRLGTGRGDQGPTDWKLQCL